MSADSLHWSGQPERFDRVLAELGLARSRSHAAQMISAGEARINGQVTVKSGTKVRRGAAIAVDVADQYVSRAAHKLLAAIEAFGLDPAGQLALDLGASTGGFTQVLLEHGASRVIAIDVGHSQLAPMLREDSRVHTVEGFNVRDLSPQSLEEMTFDSDGAAMPDLIVADLSFISLELVLPAIMSVSQPHTDIVVLIKPQFEVGRAGIRDGIVTDVRLRNEAVERVLNTAQALGCELRGLVPSPLTGEYGNQEFLAYFVRGGGTG